MTKKRIAAIFASTLICIIVIGISMYTNRDQSRSLMGSYHRELPAASWDGDALQGIDEKFSVDKNFSTHLPLVIIDTAGMQPPIYTEKRLIKGFMIYADIEGIEPYVKGSISIISGNEKNTIGDKPVSTSQMLIKRRGNSSMYYAKAQYLLKLITDKGEENKVSILNMGEDNEWILNGSMADKSMIRNYLPYKTAAQIMPYTPDNEICEVVIKNGEDYTYQGVYLIGENIKQGKDRVDIEKFKKSSRANSMLLRRDRYDENDTILDTYATKNKLSKRYESRRYMGITYIGLLYPGKKNVTKDMIDYATDEISTIEKILYSGDFDIYSTYDRYIDVDSFVDYFLINEFFGSYDSGNFSTYMYRDVGEKLKMGPVWDFDGALDNYIHEPLEVGVMAFHIKPLFDRLVRDEAFIEKLEYRYAQLRRGVLSDENINKSIDEIVNYIGPAQEREWARWSEEYTKDTDLSVETYYDGEGYVYRNSLEYSGEIYNIKTNLRKHGSTIMNSLDELKGSCIWQTRWSSRADIALLLTMLITLVSVIYIKRI
ncbi:CotH kinase family protein [Proteocatella sphenisci]|uniref:CotH kinase family protein n=1 Tax=Proteocatella sphenisci TaxID=181070 RepID=UPI00048A5E6D|nr:CotH kinase family protein [Proteocatella sphenisci]